MTALTWEAVLAWRMRRQQLTARAPRGEALDVVARIGGLHAQVLSCAELTLWARVDGLERGAVERALWEERTLVKTWAMRGTLHLLLAAELPRYVAALSRLRPRHHVPAWLRAHGLERAQADALLAAVPLALAGRQLTREELAAALRDRVYRPQGWLSPVLVVDGRIVGVWSHEVKGDRVAVAIAPFAAPEPAVRAGAEAEAERLGAFLGATPVLEWQR